MPSRISILDDDLVIVIDASAFHAGIATLDSITHVKRWFPLAKSDTVYVKPHPSVFSHHNVVCVVCAHFTGIGFTGTRCVVTGERLTATDIPSGLTAIAVVARDKPHDPVSSGRIS